MLSTPASHFYQHQIKRHPPCHLGNTISAATHHGDITTPIATEIPTTEPYINTINPPDGMTIIPSRRGTRPPVHSTESHDGQDISTTTMQRIHGMMPLFLRRQNTNNNNNNKYDMTNSVLLSSGTPSSSPLAPAHSRTITQQPFSSLALVPRAAKTEGIHQRTRPRGRERPLQRQLLTFVCV